MFFSQKIFPNQLYTIYEQLSRNRYLKNVQQHFGAIYLDRQVSSYPSIIWVPSNDTFDASAAYYQSQPVVYSANPELPNAEKRLFQFYARNAGCQLHIYHNNFSEIESIIICICNALHETFNALDNFAINSGSWNDRTQLTENTFKYVLDFSFKAPVYQLNDTQTAESLILTENFTT